ncbi:hypothetical protein EVAR_45594_1 [Eumeta japonica]|uniref:Uncharacterized protein n=1 Tax=Eumeta variegata TaxID=151549 RepID=A0A4C1YU05_EUMVA|nr:hypothetical protein EVAR_45594_1 [Eumeta japonica]
MHHISYGISEWTSKGLSESLLTADRRQNAQPNDALNCSGLCTLRGESNRLELNVGEIGKCLAREETSASRIRNVFDLNGDTVPLVVCLKNLIKIRKSLSAIAGRGAAASAARRELTELRGPYKRAVGVAGVYSESGNNSAIAPFELPTSHEATIRDSEVFNALSASERKTVMFN